MVAVRGELTPRTSPLTPRTDREVLVAGDVPSGMDRTALARAYYDCLDGDDYDRLATLLAPEFVHDRPDLTLSGRDRFVRFMREERPESDTTHEVDAIYRSGEGVAVTGRLYASDGSLMTSFLDAFAFVEESDADGDGPVIGEITTYSRVDGGDGGDDGESETA